MSGGYSKLTSEQDQEDKYKQAKKLKKAKIVAKKVGTAILNGLTDCAYACVSANKQLALFSPWNQTLSTYI